MPVLKLKSGAAGASRVYTSLADMLFGISIPNYAPQGVFPFDPDYGFKRSRTWETQTWNYSPVISQKYIMAPQPIITFEISLGAMKGTFAQKDFNSKFRVMWDFFNNHRGRLIPFYFYDPAIWQVYIDDLTVPGRRYRSTTSDRMNHPTDKTVGRYIMNFDADQMEEETFEWRLHKSDLTIKGFPG